MTMSASIHGFIDKHIVTEVRALEPVITISIGTDIDRPAPSAIPSLCENSVNVFIHGPFTDQTVALLDDLIDKLLDARTAALRAAAGR